MMCEEIFAPDLSIMPATELHRITAKVNATRFGFTDGIFTRDVMLAAAVARKLHIGVVPIK